MFLKQAHCKDCEPAQTNHFFAKLNAFSSWYLSIPLEKATLALMRALPPKLFRLIFEEIPMVTFTTLSKVGIGHLANTPSKNDNDRTRCLWEEAKRRGIEMKEYCVGDKAPGLFIARFKNNTICFQGMPRPAGPDSESLAWMDNKNIMRQIFSKVNLPIARGGVCRTKEEAETLFHKLQKPVITKPHVGSRSRHTTTHIETLEQLNIAFEKAKKLSSWVIVEEELVGFVYRGSVIGGKLAAVMRREPPYVKGDGISSVSELIKKENARPERHGHIFHEIPIDEETYTELKRQKRTLADIPKKGDLVILNQKISRGVGASNSDVTDDVHPENRKLLERVASTLGDTIVGIDFIIDDIGLPWQNQNRCGIIECNSLPFIDLHHFPLNGKARNVAGALWDVIFPNSGVNQKPSHSSIS